MRTLIRLLLLVVLSAAAANAQITSYTTNFPLTKNPISEGGRWVNGFTTGLDWNNVFTTPGFAGGVNNFNV